MKKFLLAGVVLATLGGAASAADMAVKAPYRAPPVPVWSWTGFYIGINGGYSWGSAGLTQSDVDQPGGIFTGIATNNSFSTHRIDPKGGLFGGQVGFNYQTGPVVWGVEGDWQWTDQHETACGLLCFVENVPPPVSLTEALGTTVYQKVKSFGTVRGRLGWASDGWMAYITAGGAWARIDETDTIFVGPPGPTLTAAASFSNTVSGAAYGAGIEVRLWAGLTGKVEYLHLDLSGTTNTFAVSPAVTGAGVGAFTTTTGRIQDNIFRVGLNYKLGFGGPLVAAY